MVLPKAFDLSRLSSTNLPFVKWALSHVEHVDWRFPAPIPIEVRPTGSMPNGASGWWNGQTLLVSTQGPNWFNSIDPRRDDMIAGEANILIHEAAHAFDSRVMTPAMRAEIMELWGYGTWSSGEYAVLCSEAFGFAFPAAFAEEPVASAKNIGAWRTHSYDRLSEIIGISRPSIAEGIGVTYRFGYGTTRLNKAGLETRWTWANLHPEMGRRCLEMFDAARAEGHDVGIGEGARNPIQQEAEFYRRHQLAPTSNGSRIYKGQRWYLRNGMAPLAPPGSSNHEAGVYQGHAIAVDVVGWESGWVVQNCHRFGLKHFANVNNEPWHLQPAEFPNSRSAVNVYIANGGNLILPSTPPPVVKPPPVITPPLVVTPPPVTTPSGEIATMIILDLNHNTPQWTAMQLAGNELSHLINGHHVVVLERGGVKRVKVNVTELKGVMLSVKTVNDSPFAPGKPAANTSLHTLWTLQAK